MTWNLNKIFIIIVIIITKSEGTCVLTKQNCGGIKNLTRAEILSRDSRALSRVNRTSTFYIYLILYKLHSLIHANPVFSINLTEHNSSLGDVSPLNELKHVKYRTFKNIHCEKRCATLILSTGNKTRDIHNFSCSIGMSRTRALNRQKNFNIRLKTNYLSIFITVLKEMSLCCKTHAIFTISFGSSFR